MPHLPDDLWDLDWRSTGESIRMTDPLVDYDALRGLDDPSHRLF